MQAAPIRLSLGENNTDSEGKNHGYGYLHIEASHGSQIRQAGYPTIEAFVEAVARNYTSIRLGSVVANNQTYLLELSDGHNNTLFIQLSRDGKYWNVNSAGIFNKKYSRRKPEVYSVPALGESTDTDTSEVNSGLDKGVTTPAGNSSATSAGKVSEKAVDAQGLVGIDAENKQALVDFHAKTSTSGRTSLDAEGYDKDNLVLPVLVDGKPSRISIDDWEPDSLTEASSAFARYDYSDDTKGDDHSTVNYQKHSDYLDAFNSAVPKEYRGKEEGDSPYHLFASVDAAVLYSDWVELMDKGDKVGAAALLAEATAKYAAKAKSEAKSKGKTRTKAKDKTKLGTEAKGESKSDDGAKRKWKEERAKEKRAERIEEQRAGLNSRGRFLQRMQEQGYVASVDKQAKFGIFDAVSTNSSLSHSGVHYENGYEVASDGRVLVARQSSYDPSLEGKTMRKNGEEVMGDYPDWQSVLPSADSKVVSQLSVPDVLGFLNGLISKLKGEKGRSLRSPLSNETVFLQMPDGSYRGYNGQSLYTALSTVSVFGQTEMSVLENGWLLSRDANGVTMLTSSAPVQPFDTVYNDAVPSNFWFYRDGVSQRSGLTAEEEAIGRLDALRSAVYSDPRAENRVEVKEIKGTQSDALPLLVDGKPSGLRVEHSADGVVVSFKPRKSSSASELSELLSEYGRSVDMVEGKVLADGIVFENIGSALSFHDWLNSKTSQSKPDSPIEKQQTSAVLSNEGSARELATSAVLEALGRAGIEVVEVSESEAQALLGLEALTTSDGVIYGWTDGKKIYLTPSGLNPETPLHECTHLWARAMQLKNPKL